MFILDNIYEENEYNIDNISILDSLIEFLIKIVSKGYMHWDLKLLIENFIILEDASGITEIIHKIPHRKKIFDKIESKTPNNKNLNEAEAEADAETSKLKSIVEEIKCLEMKEDKEIYKEMDKEKDEEKDK